MPKKDNPVWKKVRFPLPKKSERTHSTKRGKKTEYKREKVKEDIEQLIEEGFGQ